LHAEQIDKRTDDHEQPIHSTERPHADNSCHDHCQHRPDPHEAEKRLIVLDYSIDHLERSDEAGIIQAPEAGHHDGREGEQKAGNESTQDRCHQQRRLKEHQESVIK